MKPPNGYFAHHRMILKFVGLDLSFDKNKKWKSVYLMWFSLIISVNIVTVVQCTLATVLYTNNELVERSFVVLCGGKYRNVKNEQKQNGKFLTKRYKIVHNFSYSIGGSIIIRVLVSQKRKVAVHFGQGG